ncbi:hypothetical protein DIE04_02540 [Burkholderia sp. Bp8994]|nr:hypothetical protein DIE20_34100 [Burkholderia sp. Bp9131]RQR74822.1 hypothetical protein DIE12_11475 [Burkholderia sp. Bp9015]RQS01231.1 hypothetical protein DIE04_02540 [Burkholderia sp. Bp8994]RQS28222.1 hypothetical protein DIE05_16755 [Burkholderia sp. Bp8995]RQS38844.1 hypothetical protein DIE01_19015 [Burkholderia sp. Bp8990]RQS46868.1 hypothetical protein DIE00_16545 [Burkholderia sp. Bp8989]RQS61734.1 hypothetical protein DID98_10065 [Burkholderia sp. Bp8984]
MGNPAFSHLSPAPLVHRYGPRLRPYDTSSSICGHSKPDRAAQISRIRDVYDEAEQCFATGNRPVGAPRGRPGRCKVRRPMRRAAAGARADRRSGPAERPASL